MPESYLLNRREGCLFGYFKRSYEINDGFIEVHSLDSIEWIKANTWSNKVIFFALYIGVQCISGICKNGIRELNQENFISKRTNRILYITR